MPSVRFVIKNSITGIEAQSDSDNKSQNQSEEELQSPAKSSDNIITKSDAKHLAKSEVKKKFIIGHIYKLIDSKKNKFFVPRIFKCVKFIYSIKNVPVNIVIMKAIDDVKTQKFTLNQAECNKFHIKYEPGLEVCSMELNWKDITKNKNGCK